MIFAIICEELGLFWAVSIILIFLFMIYRFMLICQQMPRTCSEPFGGRVSAGHIAIQVILKHCGCHQYHSQYRHHAALYQLRGTSVLFLLMEMGIVPSVSNQIKLESDAQAGASGHMLKVDRVFCGKAYIPGGAPIVLPFRFWSYSLKGRYPATRF